MNKEIKHIGIIGGGKMGTNLFFFLLKFNFKLIWYTRFDVEKKRRKLSRKLKRLYPDKTETHALHCITDSLEGLKNADLILECVEEELKTKNEIFYKLDNILKPETILATISSSILPEKLFLNNNRDKYLIGMHFFYPLEIKKTVELIITEKTNKKTIKISEHFLDYIGKNILVQNKKDAFILNRIMLSVQEMACMILYEDKFSKEQIDDVIAKSLFPIGVFSMIDHIGIAVFKKSVIQYAKLYQENIQWITTYLENPPKKSTISNITESDAERIVALIKKAYFDKLAYICKKYGFLESDINTAMFDYLGENPNNWV